MQDQQSVADHWAEGDVYALILSALEKAGKSPEHLSVEDLAPIDHFHARGFPATVDLADRLPVKRDHHILDIGCGLGGPARYFATRFQCRVTGIDITPAFVQAARKLTALLGLESQVTIDRGDGQHLPLCRRSVRRRIYAACDDECCGPAPIFQRSLSGSEAGGFLCADGTRVGTNRQSASSVAVVERWKRRLLDSAIRNARAVAGRGFSRR